MKEVKFAVYEDPDMFGKYMVLDRPDSVTISSYERDQLNMKLLAASPALHTALLECVELVREYPFAYQQAKKALALVRP
jgi:hypothetical protein